MSFNRSLVKKGLKVFKIDGNWVIGTYLGTLEVQAKVYTEPSDYGIMGGRVSKLFVRTKIMKTVVLDYDRGEWMVNGDKQNLILPGLLSALEAFAQSEQFAKHVA